MTFILSLDLPWGAQNVIGAALARIHSGGVDITVHAVEMPTNPAGGLRDAEIDAFIRTGAALGTALPGDSAGPFPPGMPNTTQLRKLYVDRVAASLVNIAEAMPDTRGTDVLLIDVPLVPEGVAQANPPQPQKQAKMRPLERAFQCKVRVPVANAHPNQTNLARFQAGVMRGYRPGYALAHLAMHVFSSETVLESFPQLVLGALAEMALALKLPPPLGLTHHKRPPFDGQDLLMHLITTYVGRMPRWASDDLAQSAMADGFDALLGLLPVLPLYGIRPPGEREARYAMPIKLRNLAQNPVQGIPRRPERLVGTIPAHALNCRHWIAANLKSRAASTILAFGRWILMYGGNVERTFSHRDQGFLEFNQGGQPAPAEVAMSTADSSPDSDELGIVRATSTFDCGGRCPLRLHVKGNRIIRVCSEWGRLVRKVSEMVHATRWPGWQPATDTRRHSLG